MPKVNSFYGLSLGKFYIATFFCFFSLVACSFKEKEKKPRKFSVCVALGFIKAVFYTFVIMSIRLLGCLSKAQFISSSGRVL